MMNYSTDSMDLPSSIREALGMIRTPQAGMYAYEDGGMVGPGGMPVEPAPMPPPMSTPVATPAGLGSVPAVPTSAPIAPLEDIEASIQKLQAQAPEKLAEIRAMMMQAVQSGELTPEELNMMVQLAQVAAQDPSMYPQIRKFAIQQGLTTEAELPVQYDQTLVIALLVVAKSLQQGEGAPPPQAPIMMEMGGKVPAATSTDGAVPIMAHEGEYVIPKGVVDKKGFDFFDKLIESGKPEE